MTIEEARKLLGNDYKLVPDESIHSLIKLMRAVCKFVITHEDELKDLTD